MKIPHTLVVTLATCLLVVEISGEQKGKTKRDKKINVRSSRQLNSKNNNADQMVQNILQWLQDVYGQQSRTSRSFVFAGDLEPPYSFASARIDRRALRQGSLREYLPPTNSQKPRPFEPRPRGGGGIDEDGNFVDSGYPPAGITPQPPFTIYTNPATGGITGISSPGIPGEGLSTGPGSTNYPTQGSTRPPYQPGFPSGTTYVPQSTYYTERPGIATQAPDATERPGYPDETERPAFTSETERPAFTSETEKPTYTSQTGRPVYPGETRAPGVPDQTPGISEVTPRISEVTPGYSSGSPSEETQGYPTSSPSGFTGYPSGRPQEPGSTGYTSPGTGFPTYPTSSPSGFTGYTTGPRSGFPSFPTARPTPGETIGPGEAETPGGRYPTTPSTEVTGFTGYPTGRPTATPGSPTGYPTRPPTGYPSESPTGYPSGSPTGYPSGSPTGYPSGSPTGYPSASPTGTTGFSTAPPSGATGYPTGSTGYPTGSPPVPGFPTAPPPGVTPGPIPNEETPGPTEQQPDEFPGFPSAPPTGPTGTSSGPTGTPTRPTGTSTGSTGTPTGPSRTPSSPTGPPTGVSGLTTGAPSDLQTTVGQPGGRPGVTIAPRAGETPEQTASPNEDNGTKQVPDDDDLKHPPHIHALDVQCAKDMMTINIEFNREFNGVIYSKGYYNMPECRYVNENSGQTKYTFTVNLNMCGTEFVNAFDTEGQSYLENILVLQNELGIQEVWDTVRSVRCLWEGNLKEQLSVTLMVGMLSQEIVTFSGDTAMAKLDVLLGRGPFGQPASGLVKIGEQMTLVVSVSGDPGFDVQVKDCRATDSSGSNVVPLTDDNGCILKPKLFGSFQKTRNTGETGASIIAYAYFNAFKFPDVMDIMIECNIELCKTDCEMCTDPNPQLEPAKRRRRDVSLRNETLHDSILMAKHLRVILPEDLASAVELVQHDGVCMSTQSFVYASSALISLLTASCLLSAYLWFTTERLRLSKC